MKMDQNLNLAEYLDYLDGKLSPEEKEKFEESLMEDSHNLLILKGLSVLKKKYGSTQKVKQVIDQKKQILLDKVIEAGAGKTATPEEE